MYTLLCRVRRMISTFSYMPAMCIFSRVFAFAFFSQDPFAPYPQGGGKPAPFSNTQAEDFLPPPPGVH